MTHQTEEPTMINFNSNPFTTTNLSVDSARNIRQRLQDIALSDIELLIDGLKVRTQVVLADDDATSEDRQVAADTQGLLNRLAY